MATNAWGLHGYEHHHERSLVDTYWLLPAAFTQGNLSFSVPQEAALPQPQTRSSPMVSHARRPSARTADATRFILPNGLTSHRIRNGTAQCRKSFRAGTCSVPVNGRTASLGVSQF